MSCLGLGSTWVVRSSFEIVWLHEVRNDHRLILPQPVIRGPH